jgi:hypothetical protein
VRVVFVYLGSSREAPGFVLELLPRFAAHVYPDQGHVTVAWLLWACELQWVYAK